MGSSRDLGRKALEGSGKTAIVSNVPSEGFQIDLENPAEIRAKMPDIRRLYDEKRTALEGLTAQVELLGRLVGEQQPPPSQTPTAGAPTTSSPKPAKASKAGQYAPGQDRAVKALEHANRPMGPTSLFKYMEANGMDLPKNPNALGSNLWSAWKAGRIMRAPNGVYTPLDGSGRTEWDRPLTDYDYAASQGMPTPSSLAELPGPTPNGSATAGQQTSPQPTNTPQGVVEVS